MPLPTRVYLTGFMGSGKSTLGPIIASVLGYRFLDLDTLVEERAGTTIPELFAGRGERRFRRLEFEALRTTTTMERVVVATGGGTLVRQRNLDLTRRHGTVLYLHVPLDKLVPRLFHSPTRRPLLEDEHGERLPMDGVREVVTALYRKRQPFYEQADLCVDVGDSRVGVSVDAVVAALRRYRG